jgi:hypothetical protein
MARIAAFGLAAKALDTQHLKPLRHQPWTPAADGAGSFAPDGMAANERPAIDAGK